MGRFLSVLLLSASFASSPALAVNIGQVSAYSSANKPLRMDVELIDLQGARLNDVLMRVADETDHERFGLQRPAWADGSFVRVLNKDSSSFVARLNSTRPVSASNVDFVVELRAGSTVTWHKVSAALGSGSPMLALPAESKPIVEKVAPVPVPIATPTSVPALEQEFVAEEPIVTNDVAAFDATSTDGSALDIEQDIVAEPVFDDTSTVDDALDMSASASDEMVSESKLKPHEYFTRVLILFFILGFAIAGLIAKLIKKIRKS